MSTNSHLHSIQDIFFACNEDKYIATEHFIPEHGLSHIYSGEVTVTELDKSYTLRAGDTVLFARNQLAKFVKHPGKDEPFRSAAIFFRRPFLQKYYTEHRPLSIKESLKNLYFSKEPLVDSLFASLRPYSELTSLPQELIDIKIQEAITILRSLDKRTDAILGTFGEPGKIDLADFMQRNYTFNIPLQQFAYLSGRSLATFKRDFQKVFHTSPQRWLSERRLKQAHFLIAEHKQKPSDVYLEVGFENLSHFSASFKQMFGYNPSSIA